MGLDNNLYVYLNDIVRGIRDFETDSFMKDVYLDEITVKFHSATRCIW